jgi:prepilin-type N-terminal cleavage/methylation domain-containing protein
MAARRRRGHSLLESLIVMAIIAILLGMLSPCLVKAVQMARRTAGTAQSSRQ